MARLRFHIPWPISSAATRELLRFSFLVSFVMYGIMFGLEAWRPGVVAVIYHVETFFWTAIILGIASAAWPVFLSDQTPKHPPRQGIIWICLMALVATFLLWETFAAHTPWAGIIAVVGGLVVAGFGWLIHATIEEHET